MKTDPSAKGAAGSSSSGKHDKSGSDNAVDEACHQHVKSTGGGLDTTRTAAAAMGH